MWKYRNSHQRCSMKKDILRNFAKFTWKHLCQSLFFNKVAGLGLRLWHRCFPMKFSKFLRAPFLQNTSGWLLPEIYISSQKNKWVSSSKEFLIKSQFVEFFFEKISTYTIIILSRKIFKQITEVLCNMVHDIW